VPSLKLVESTVSADAFRRGVEAITQRTSFGFAVAKEITRRFVQPPPQEFSDADVKRAKDYLRDLVMRSGKNFQRRNSDELGWAHSERVAETAYNLARFVYGNDKGKLNRVVILALLHDTVEDFGGNLKEIERMFGKAMANSVALVTTPRLGVLAHRYGNITAKHLPNEDFSTYSEENMGWHLKLMKVKQHAQYKRLKGELNRQHKLDMFPHYGLDEAIVKIADNGDSPHTDAKDIAAKRVHVNVPTAPERSDKTRKTWPEAKVRGKVDARTEFHLALIAQLKKVAKMSKTLRHLGLKSPNFPGLFTEASQFFVSKVENLERITGLSFPRPPALELR
jgi:hypothetical protein